MSCYITYNLDVAKEKSELYKDLLKKFNNAERADIVYERLIAGNQNSDTSFNKWLSRNDEDISEREPTIEEFNDWIKDLNQQARITKTFKTPNLVTTVQEHTDLSEGFTFRLVETMLEEGLSLNDLVNKNERRIQQNNIFNKTLRKVIADMQEEIDYQKENNDDYSRIEEIKNELTKPENIELFKNAYNAFTELNFGFKLNDIGFFNEYSEDNQLNESIEQNEEKETRDSAFDKSAIEFNTKDGAPKAIKLIIASLPQINKDGTSPLSSLGTPKLVNYNQTFSYLLDNLAGLPADMEIFMDKLKELVTIKPELQKLIDVINFGKEGYIPSKDESRRQAEMLLRTQFVNQFDKTRYTYSLNIIDENGFVKTIDANLDRIQHIKVQQWESNFKLLQLENPEKYSEKGYKKLLEGYEKNTLTMKEFIQSLGIESIDYNQLFKNNREQFKAIVDYGMSSYEKFLNIYKKTNAEVDVTNRFLEIAKFEAVRDGSTTDLQHYNVENKLVYDISLNTYLSNMVKDFNHYSGQKAKLKELYPEIFNNPYYEHSLLVNKILDIYQFGDGKMKIGIVTGIENKINGKSEDISKLNEKDLLFERIFSLLNEGQFHFLRAADRKLENFFTFENSPRDILMIENKDEAKSTMIDYLFDEVALMKSYEANNPEVVYSKRDELFQTRIFRNKDGKSIYDVVPFKKLSKMSYEDMKTNQKVREFMNDFIEEIVAEETAFIGEQNLTDSDFSQITEQYGIQNPIERFILNSFVLNIETAKLFAGDTALFKNVDDFVKRMSMLNSTKEGTRTDAEMNQFIASLTNEFEQANGYEDGRSPDNSQIRTITINDVESSIQEFTQEELNTLEEEIKNISGYENINEADGFAFITYDEMRIMKNRYGEWFAKDEDLYQKLASAKKEGKEYRITEDEHHSILPDKSQYTGKLLNNTQHNIVAGRKFSFITLAPGMYKKGSVLERLHNDMASQGVGMAFFTSAAKFGHTSPDGKNAHHSLYDNNGQYNIDLQNNNKFDILDYKYLGNQLKINSIEKKETTEGTQKRKLNLSNFYRNGVVNEDVKDLINEYNQLQTEKIKRAYKNLTSKMGFKEGIEEVDRQKFVDNLLETGIEQGFTTNELGAIQTLLETPFFEGLANRQKIENFVNAKLANKVIKQKRNGTALAQASNVGFEINVDNNLEKTANRHDLKSYRKSKDGTRMLPMEVAIPLPKKLIKYIEAEYGKGVGKGISESDLQRFNDDIARDNQIFEETGKQTDLTKITMMVGFRIPTQGAASMEVAKVKYFLMPHIGGSIVVPKTIVAKTGSDFDIDKLNLYYPEYTVSGDKNSFIANKFAGELSVQAKRKILFAEDVDTDIYGITGSELNQVFIENILQADRESLNTDWARTLNRLYNDSLINKPYNIEYISTPEIETLVKTNSVEVKEGVDTVFESNPKLASEVYEALGFEKITHYSQNNKNPLDNFNPNQPLYTTKSGEEYSEYGTKFDYFINPNANIKNIEDFNGKYEIDLDKFEQYSKGVQPFPINVKQLNSIKKEGVDILIDDWGEYIIINPEKALITPQQKQQAQQLYSQYLDTIFPDSKEDRILAHASHATNIEKFEKRPNKNFFGFAQLGRGVYLTDLYYLDYWRHELELENGEGKNYYVKVNLQNTVGVNNFLTKEKEESLSETVDAVYENRKPHEEENNWKPNQYAVRNPEKIHILGSKQDIEGFKKFVKETPQQTNLFEDLSDKQLSNKTLENEIALTLHPSNWKELLTPLDKQNLFDKSNPNNKNTIVGMLRELTGETGKKNNLSDLNKTSFNIRKMIEFLSGKGGVGQTAVHNTNHTLAQKAGLRMTGEFDFFGVSQKDGYIDLGNVINEDGESISELIDELLSAYVDIAKDPFVREINAVQETANVILMMMRQGVGLQKIYTFMNQPIIKEYIKQDSLRKSVSSKDDKMMSNENLVRLVLSNFNMGNKDFETMMSQGNNSAYDNFTLQELKDGIKTKGANSQKQLKALDVFLLLKEQSKTFQEMIRSTSPDTQSFKSFNILENQLKLRKKVKDSMMFQNYEKMFDDFIGEFWNTKNDYKNKISQFMLTQQDKFKKQLDILKGVFADVNAMAGQDAVEAQMSKIDNDFVIGLLQEFGVFNLYSEGGNVVEELFEGKNSIPAAITRLKKHWKENDIDPNVALDNLLPILNDFSVPIHNMKPIQKKLTSIDKENIYQAMRELYSYSDYISDVVGVEDFYGKFITFALLQSGLNNSPYNITQFIPSEFYKIYVNQAIEKANISEKGLSYFADVIEPGIFVLNNLNKLYKQDKFIQLEGNENKGLPYTIGFDKVTKRFYTQDKATGKMTMQKGYGVRQIDPTPIIITKQNRYSAPEKINIDC